MSLLSWLSQSESGLDDVDFATTSTNAANRKMDAADMTDETPSPERKAVNLSRQTDIVVELSQISPTRKKEFVLVEDLDDDYDVSSALRLSFSSDGSGLSMHGRESCVRRRTTPFTT